MPLQSRFVRSIKSECFNRMILLGEQSLRRALREYSTHYLGERNHQGLINHLLEESPKIVAFSTEPVKRRERLGGMLNYYYREIA